MRKFIHDACESLDASVFSGDLLYVPMEREEVRKYIERWARAFKEHDDAAKVEHERRQAFETDWQTKNQIPMNTRMHDEYTYADQAIQKAWEQWPE